MTSQQPTPSKKPQIGFCGLGAMGGGMAGHLAKSGYKITGFDVYPRSIEKLVAAGGYAATSPAMAAQNADFLILMVVNSEQVNSVLFDSPSGAVTTLPRDASVIVCSTCPPTYLPELRAKLDGPSGRPDLTLLDCPVSGGSIRAAQGNLSVLASGPDAGLEAANDVLVTMSSPLYQIPGGLGFGSIAKMCHQHQAAVNVITSSEVMALAASAGLNTRSVYEHVIKSKGRSFFLENRGPHMLENDFKTVHSAVSIILKDVIIVTNHAMKTGFPLLLENMAQQLYIKGTFAGLTKEDDAGLVRLYLSEENLNTIMELAAPDAGVITGKAGITVDTIVDLMAGIQLASATECMRFAEHVGMDLDFLCDIVCKGAGQSAVFDQVAKAVSNKTWKGPTSLENSSRIIEGLETALQKIREIHQPCPMGETALQLLRFDLLNTRRH